MVVINPYLIIGPSLNTSNKIFVDLLGGEYPGVMSITWGIVDVRDVSRAHIKAMEDEDAQGRFICVKHTVDMGEVVTLLKEKGYGTGSYLRTHIGRVPRFDCTKSEEVLELNYTPVQKSILDTVDDLKKWGHLKS